MLTQMFSVLSDNTIQEVLDGFQVVRVFFFFFQNNSTIVRREEPLFMEQQR